ncbi:formylglycine-generating enzyme family protein [Sphingomonas sp. C3-2]|uniref:formylglycine-generating enzyme family protein n=1 Tax=Sphingomonas sp. C3-2 TaxID=3062169 RepID=UPI00294B1173|nr:formylglycine-generating enzyme family protein [Sphingomonas sp. C3-2]WOK38326.1 formylglycine-generating enzyme family protein [Sphingomonas sp. C3-2]
MIHLTGGIFWMGSNDHYPEEAPCHPVAVDPFWIDEAPVTNRQFKAFIAATGHVTSAETPPNPDDYPGAHPDMLRPASLVFTPPEPDVVIREFSQWWDYRIGADWRHPLGPGSSLDGLDDHPVVHIAYDDALAYARWAGKELPSEAEWEFAARGGLDRAEFAWGDELMPGGVPQANTWQGAFPRENSLLDGYLRTSPVRAYSPNGYGIFDMIGNVWEWTGDYYADHQPGPLKTCCAPRNPRGAVAEESFDPAMPAIRIARKVLKGGSHLCAPNYCRRYRPAARHPQPVDTSTSHVGFRCVIRTSDGASNIQKHS